ncbi:hypothetical protein FIU88_06235 [Halomonas sp. THAF12]|nr:hypothetical protein FIU88_06235 [Halomonas sp. THAF12]
MNKVVATRQRMRSCHEGKDLSTQYALCRIDTLKSRS